MRRVMRIACVAYIVFLSLLLLSPNPATVIGCSDGLPWVLQTLMPYAHLLSFSVFAILMLLARWPMPRWSIALLLAAYGGATEIIQGFIPPRTPEWADWFQDVGGVAMGIVLCSLLAMVAVWAAHHVGSVGIFASWPAMPRKHEGEGA